MTSDKSNGESIPGLDPILARAMSTAVCRECRKDISVNEWRENAKMCKSCYDTDGTDNTNYVD